MLRQLHNFDRQTPFLLACSGGVDSMAIADFYKRGNKNFTVAYFNHRTPQANAMMEVVRTWAMDNSVPYVMGMLDAAKPKGISPEEHWRNERYKWLKSFQLPVVICHHLNDCLETWLFGAMNGFPKLIASAIEGGDCVGIYRPFLTNTKQELIDWAVRHNVKWLEDKSNEDVHSPRNRIRHNIIPEVLKINPGILKVIKKKMLAGKEGWDLE